MSRFLRVSTVLVALATMLLLAAPVATAEDVFSGTWTSVDTDGSNQILWVSGSGQSGRYAVSLYDDAASQACNGAPARAQGAGIVEDDTLYWTATITCPGSGRGPAVGRIGPLVATYDEGTDTLVDDSGVVWSRLD